jgi:flagellar export protein FliJ
MTPRFRLLTRVKRTRQRLRDAAAGELTAAEIAAQQANEHLEEVHAEIEQSYDDASQNLGKAESVNAFFDFEDARRAATHRLVSANEDRRKSEQHSAARREVLVGKEQELRRTEKLLDRERDHVTDVQNKLEQKQSDDRVATQHRNKP